jgi:aryl-alcohol dehydrogenase-like predicted oxidoreductase
MSLGIGAVQFGLAYGLSQHSKCPDSSEVFSILYSAKKSNIKYLDTAPSYGLSEQRIGQFKDCSFFNIVTKTPKFSFSSSKDIRDQLSASIHNSLKLLNRTSLDAVLIHEPSDLRTQYANDIIAQLEYLKTQGLINKIGISIYTSDDFNLASQLFNVDIVQCPLNVFDQRLLTDGTLTGLSRAGIEIHLRSIFLKGILINRDIKTNPTLQKFSSHINNWFDYCNKNSISPYINALSFIKSLPINAVTLVGVSTLQQLNQLLTDWDTASSCNIDEFSKFSIDSCDLLDPRTW